ncbi:DUF1599 domain-containing protein [Psychroflexus sediminis]|uniref:Nucleotide modification associated domain-containing protein n=1 Tax=Psychroflexus sediminis TaxID=470826 RepID=A0A1G7Z1L7_9FLAO|nr:DUF1599 domain-containing protein [Psychroflexus sediminis]SDH02070.1 protein of unknown function [Psychroflexus sediminis]
MNTNKQFDLIIKDTRNLFVKKTKDYGTAWRILRLTSLTDQIFIKASRIRSLQENYTQRVEENEDSEFVGIINYSIMALIQIELGVSEKADLNADEAVIQYNLQVEKAKSLMKDKNHDYGEVWRKMRVSSLTDLILQKLLRIKQIEDNAGKTLVSEGIEAGYLDIINYSIFALIHLNFKEQ